jgi:hypothetical protein
LNTSRSRSGSPNKSPKYKGLLKKSAKSKNFLPGSKIGFDDEEDFAFKNIDFESYGGENFQRNRYQ